MNKKTALENYTLFYEKLETEKPAEQKIDSGSDDTSYEKAPCLNVDQIKALQEDLQSSAKTETETQAQ